MSIPKIIHYCWFGGNPKPKLAKKCIKSWKKYCPDYKIIEWNETNFDISSAPLYVRQAYAVKKWAFVTDYVRLKIVYDNGGIYLDTDVELLKPLDCLLNHNAFFGFENNENIATGLGFGSIKNAAILKDLMYDYRNIPFIQANGSYDDTTCPARNTKVFLKYGLIQDNKLQVLSDDIIILPSEYLCPIEYISGCLNKTPNTFAIHWFSGSWQTKEEHQKRNINRKQNKAYRRKDFIHNLTHIPNKLAKKLLGEKHYNSLKNILKEKNE